MGDRQIKVTVEHEPGCITVVIIGILLGLMLAGKMNGCVINIGSEINATDGKQIIVPRESVGER